MAIQDMNSVWQYMESFRVYFKALASSSLKTIAEYSAYFKTQIFYYAAQTQVWLASAYAYISLGFKYAYDGLFAFIQNLPSMAKYAWDKAIHWLIQGFHYGQRFLRFMLDVAEIIVKGLWNRICIIAEFLYNEVPKLLGQFIRNIPYYLNQTWLLIKDCALAIKDTVIKLYELALPFVKAFWNAFTDFISRLATHAFEAIKMLFTAVAKRIFMGIGIIYGISSVLVETLGYGLNALTMKAFGLNLAHSAAFAAVQTGLSIALASVATAAIAYYSYKAVCYLYRAARESIHTLRQQIPLLQQRIQRQAQPQVDAQAQNTIAHEEQARAYLPAQQHSRNQARQQRQETQEAQVPRRSARLANLRAA